MIHNYSSFGFNSVSFSRIVLTHDLRDVFGRTRYYFAGGEPSVHLHVELLNRDV